MIKNLLRRDLLSRVFGSRNDRVLARMRRSVSLINQLEPSLQAMEDAQLQAKSSELKERFQQGETLDELLVEAFALVREASRRVLKMRHFDVQLLGGMILHEGRISEMRTGEGKTLVSTLAAYLNALPGKGIHIVTVNDYLVTRDAKWMEPIYHYLGMSIGTIVSGMNNAEKQAAYACDIIYGTNNEFGFDYLRDNMALNKQEKVQRDLHFAIVDEVDSILIDEARTPLIISGPTEEGIERYLEFNDLVQHLTLQKDPEHPGDFTLDEKTHQAHLTETGHERIEALLVERKILDADESLYASHNVALLHYLNAALRAHYLFHKDVAYIVREGQVIIVDEHTGRTMIGRRWSDGLHQAIEAKEKVAILPENQTLASITFQNYFRLYKKLAGMTGTADTEAYEFQQIYGLEVNVVPTNQPVHREDKTDQIYLTKNEKFVAVLKDIQEARERGQPVLVGTVSIDISELLSNLLNQANIPHRVLNAKFHEQEAQIIAEAGRPGTVTIATNMAGRGTDIVLGGNVSGELAALNSDDSEVEDKRSKIKQEWQERHDQVIAAGGLHIIGTERHESRRIDNQLRGRAGRQGDPGSSRFYLSLEDNLVRIFASDKIGVIMRKLGMKENEPIEHPLINKAIENAQCKVEGFNCDMRKQLMEYDNIANEQRQIIYKQRAELLNQDNILETILDLRNTVAQELVERFFPKQSFEEQWDIAGLTQTLEQDFRCTLPIQAWFDEENFEPEHLRSRILEALAEQNQQKEALIGAESMRQFEKTVMLQTLDMLWREHLAAMDYLRQGIGLRGYAQKNPKQEYKREAFELFSQLIDRLKYQVTSYLSSVIIQTQEAVLEAEEERLQSAPQEMTYIHEAMSEIPEIGFDSSDPSAEEFQKIPQPLPMDNTPNKVSRNHSCPCGSGKKYKYCHGELV